MELYTAVVIAEVLALAILWALVCGNPACSERQKAKFFWTYAVLSVSILGEWLASFLNGSDPTGGWLIRVGKLLDYSLSPLVAILLVRQISMLKKVEPYAFSVLGLNVLFQFVSLFTGWSYRIDGDGYYRHGVAHYAYVAVFALAILYAIVAYILYGRKFQKKNLFSFLLIVCFTVLGLLAQELIGPLLGKTLRICGLANTIACILLYVHYIGFDQQQNQRDLLNKERLLLKDTLSDCFSRYAYDLVFEEFSKKPLPSHFVVMMVDVNGLKRINDRFGHEHGDRFIQAAGRVLGQVAEGKGQCFRTGGDEFILFLDIQEAELERRIAKVHQTFQEWGLEKKEPISCSIGYAYASSLPGEDLAKLISIADQRMYGEKKAFYEANGLIGR